jgi:circadian clock protein KaiA
LHSTLLIGSLIFTPDLAQQVEATLPAPGYQLHQESDPLPFAQWVGENRHRVDCLLLESQTEVDPLLTQLQKRDILLPTVLLVPKGSPVPAGHLESAIDTPERLDEPLFPSCSAAASYHTAIACLPQTNLALLEQYIHQAIDQFLHISHHQEPQQLPPSSVEDTRHFLLSLQQQRLTEKLRERLGYLGVYYKRNPQNFLRHLAPDERAEVLDKLKADYRRIVLNYFAKEVSLNQHIDDFVNVAFFADASVSQIVEIHMELMDDFSKQLKLEGRSEEILLDYRLTLIDVIAHLCEMYRRSIPREM